MSARPPRIGWRVYVKVDPTEVLWIGAHVGVSASMSTFAASKRLSTVHWFFKHLSPPD